jgi:hypothetical protein
LADDVEFLDLIALTALSLSQTAIDCGEKGNASGEEQVLVAIAEILHLLLEATVQNPKPYAAHLAQLKARGKKDDLSGAVLPCIGSRMMDMPDEIYEKLANVWAKLNAMFFPDTLVGDKPEMKQWFKTAKDFRTSYGEATESCDHCHAEPVKGATKLQKCGACKVARYCSKRCQMAAWKSGHREACRKE